MNVAVEIVPTFLPRETPETGFRLQLATWVGGAPQLVRVLQLWPSLEEPAARAMAERLVEEELAAAVSMIQAHIDALPAPSFDLPPPFPELTMTPAIFKAAELMAARLRILQKLQAQARDRGETTVELHAEEVFEAGDRAALEAFEKAVSEMTGKTPLPFEVAV